MTDYSSSIERFSGFADLYDQYRPAPPAVIGELLARLAGTPVPELVVDLGAGTGLSTRYWAERANTVIGIEPTADMRRQAEAVTRSANVRYRAGFSHQTGLPDGCAQIVTCSQALHWMEPQPTFQEAARILQPGGVFAAFDYDWPPTTGVWQADEAYELCMRRAAALEAERIEAGRQASGRQESANQELGRQESAGQGADHPMLKEVPRWEKDGHLGRMAASGCFRYTKEIVIHHVDLGSAERLVGLALSQGGVMTLLKQGLSEDAVGITQLRQTAAQVLGSQPREWLWSSRVRIGIK